MGTILASTIIDSAAKTLQDETGAQWDRAELFGYVNDGQRDLALVKPNAYAVNDKVQLVAGTKQAIPADGREFVRLVCNMGSNGTTPGRVPRRIDPEAMDRQNPSWHSASASSAVWDYVFDPRDPKHFYVSPPQPASAQGHVALVYFGVPPDLGDETDAIALDDTYVTALTHYVIYRAYLKEGEFNNPAGAMAHRSEFLGLLGAKDRAELAAGAA